MNPRIHLLIIAVIAGAGMFAASLWAQGNPSPVETSKALAAPNADAAAGALLQGVQGSWKVIMAYVNGKESGERDLREGHWKFLGNELTLETVTKGTGRFMIRIDAKADPEAFEVTALDPVGAGPGWMLFRREGKTLKIAFNDNLQGRPVGFEPTLPPTKPALVVVTLELLE